MCGLQNVQISHVRIKQAWLYMYNKFRAFQFTATFTWLFYPNLVEDEIGSIWITLRPLVSLSVSQTMETNSIQGGRTVVKDSTATPPSNHFPLDIVFEIGITRATAYTG